MKGMLQALMLGGLLAATAAGAQTVYKSTNPDGSIVYSDKPPASGKIDKIIEFPDLPSSAVPPLPAPSLSANPAPGSRAVLMMHTPQGARVVQSSMPPPQPSQLSTRVESNPSATQPVRPPPPPVTLYSAVWCGYCRRAKAYLADHHIGYLNVDIDSPDGRAEFDGMGGGGVPLLMSGRKKVRGFKVEGYDAFFARREAGNS